MNRGDADDERTLFPLGFFWSAARHAFVSLARTRPWNAFIDWRERRCCARGAQSRDALARYITDQLHTSCTREKSSGLLRRAQDGVDLGVQFGLCAINSRSSNATLEGTRASSRCMFLTSSLSLAASNLILAGSCVASTARSSLSASLISPSSRWVSRWTMWRAADVASVWRVSKLVDRSRSIG